VHNVVNSAHNMVDDVKRTFTEEVRATRDAHEAKKAAEAAAQARQEEAGDSQRPSDDDDVIY